MEKSYVGYNNCFYCGEINEILIDNRLQNTLNSNMGVMNMNPCSKCQKYMEMGIILISIRDNTTEEEMKGPIPNPYRTGKWCVVKEEYINKTFNDQNMINFAIKNRFMFIIDSAWEMLGLPTENINNIEKKGE